MLPRTGTSFASSVRTVIDSSVITRIVKRVRGRRPWRATMGGAQRSVAGGREQHTAKGLELLERLTGSECDGVERVGREPDRHAGLVLETGVEAREERAATGQDDALLHDVGSQLWGRLVERELHGVEDGGDRLLDGPADLDRRRDDRLGKAGHEVATAHLGLHLALEGPRR